jgi:hypothetical protein
MNGRIITLILNNEKTEFFSVITGISQDFFCFFILFLFYIAELHNLYDVPALNMSVVDFVNDTQLLIFDNIKKSNCQRLTKIHDRCI